MNDKEGRHFWTMVGYLSAFFGIYLLSILYTIVPNVIPLGVTWSESASNSNSFVYSANATMSTNSTIAGILPLLAVVVAAGVVVSVLVSAFSFSNL